MLRGEGLTLAQEQGHQENIGKKLKQAQAAQTPNQCAYRSLSTNKLNIRK